MNASLALLRPRHWLKNFFVFAPVIFARELFHAGPFLETIKAFAAFSLTASAVYIINDFTDLEADRAHPEKRNRPLAAGTITTSAALILLVAVTAIAASIAVTMDPYFAAILGCYFVMNLAYSLKLKEIVLLDVFIIAAGFMLRILGGAYAIHVNVSNWIVLCSLFISLFLGFAKRRGELVQVAESGKPAERKVLQAYRIGFVDQMLTIAAAGAVISYALYTVAPRTVAEFGTERMIYTTVFVLYGVFRYLYLIHTTHKTENPAIAVSSDLPILVTGILWIVSCVMLIYHK